MSAKWIWSAVAVLVAGGAGLAVWLHLRRGPSGPVARTESSFEFTAHAPLRKAFPLFGGFGEKAWGGDSWNPRFLYPQPPRDVPGEVFTVEHGHHDAVWVNTAFDADAGRIQYVYVLPGVMAVIIDLALAEADGGANTLVKVTYRRTALHSDMNERVKKLGEEDAKSGPEWEADVNEAIRSGAAR